MLTSIPPKVQSRLSTRGEHPVKGILSPPNIPPLVVVEGFMGSEDLKYWRHLAECQPQDRNLPQRRILFVKLGAMSSIHDRCCELFYQIKGGIVDYGEKHSKAMGHKRFGKAYHGLYREWSKSNPVHILGHSLGGLTCWHFQQMLANKEFSCKETSEEWLSSMTTFFAPLRGTTLVYALGSKENHPDKVRKCSVGSMIYRLCYLFAWLNLSKFGFGNFDLNLDHWQIQKHSLLTMMYNFFNGVQFDSGKDNAVTDIMVEACEKRNKNSKTFSKTYYRSYAASMTYNFNGVSLPYLNIIYSWKQILMSFLVGIFTFTSQPLSNSSSEWRENDGAIPKISAFHPGRCSEGKCNHKVYNFNEEPQEPCKPFWESYRPGTWYVSELPKTSHFDVIRCSKETLPAHYKVILTEFWNWLRFIDDRTSKEKQKSLGKRFMSFGNIKPNKQVPKKLSVTFNCKDEFCFFTPPQSPSFSNMDSSLCSVPC